MPIRDELASYGGHPSYERELRLTGLGQAVPPSATKGKQSALTSAPPRIDEQTGQLGHHRNQTVASGV